MWDECHDEAQQSTSLERAERKDPALSRELQQVYDYCLPYYYQLAARVIPSTV
jgi:hypothetical protein